MSTRSVIATGNAVNFTGVYHHWDGYPSGVGFNILNAFRGHFNRDYAKMLQVLIYDRIVNSQYWSSICADWDKPIGPASDKGHEGPCVASYGVGDVNETNAAGMGCEYAYVLTADKKMLILSSRTPKGKMVGMFGCGDPDATWVQIGEVDLCSDSEPDWENLDKQG